MQGVGGFSILEPLMCSAHRPVLQRPHGASGCHNPDPRGHVELPGCAHPNPEMLLHDVSLPSGHFPRGFRHDRKLRFELGRLFITRSAAAALSDQQVRAAISRHARCDWGHVTRQDWLANEQAVRVGGQLVSVYHSAEGVKFYVITDAGRDVTTLLLPEDY